MEYLCLKERRNKHVAIYKYQSLFQFYFILDLLVKSMFNAVIQSLLISISMLNLTCLKYFKRI
jgi:hypothetical protein